MSEVHVRRGEPTFEFRPRQYICAAIWFLDEIHELVGDNIRLAMQSITIISQCCPCSVGEEDRLPFGLSRLGIPQTKRVVFGPAEEPLAVRAPSNAGDNVRVAVEIRALRWPCIIDSVGLLRVP